MCVQIHCITGVIVSLTVIVQIEIHETLLYGHRRTLDLFNDRETFSQYLTRAYGARTPCIYEHVSKSPHRKISSSGVRLRHIFYFAKLQRR
jgi:hypothetical protein